MASLLLPSSRHLGRITTPPFEGFPFAHSLSSLKDRHDRVGSKQVFVQIH